MLCETCEHRETEARNAGLRREHEVRKEAGQRAVSNWLDSAPLYNPGYLTQATERYQQELQRLGRSYGGQTPSTVTVPMSEAIEHFTYLIDSRGSGFCPTALSPGSIDKSDLWEIATHGVPPSHHEILRLTRYRGSLGGVGHRDKYAGSVFRSTDGICVLWRWYANESFYD
ncbi:hypothetical protein EV652_104103 [Kribbella steppae]|uniref:Uncharacterized protein n=1 Tax=Kribbella steppae TaxID=2512223 RepID=A0A4R2HN85_9ACTN|nr:hypothetical protein EV652_104103 [Kribbella steppae]